MGGANKIAVLVTGVPAPAVGADFGSFPAMIHRAVGPDWPGGWVELDARLDVGAAPAGRSAAAHPALRPDPAAVVITGSPASVCEGAPWMHRAQAWLRQRVANGTPVLGICFGHQLLAQALGGTVRPNPRGLEVGTATLERLGDDPLLAGLPRRFAANCFHDDAVVVPPPGAVTLARSERDAHHCLRFAPRCYGVQFHPEFDGDVMRAYVRARASSIRAARQQPDRLLARVEEATAAQRVLRNFTSRIARP